MSDQHAGLADVIAGQSAICTVGKEGRGLSYRGYAIEALAQQTCFEEVAYLLLYGELPTANELVAFSQRLVAQRGLPAPLREILEKLPASSHPMDVLRSACSVLGCLEAESETRQQTAIAERLLAMLPAALLYWYHYQQQQRRIDTRLQQPDIAGYFLALLHQSEISDAHRHALDVSLTLYAEHEFNASTFAARVSASTLSDFYSCVTSAIGTLRGPLHGGANEATMAFIGNMTDADNAEQEVLRTLTAHEKIMGFGHRVYKESDPRNAVIKPLSAQLATTHPDGHLYAISERVESVMWREKRLFPNLDFYSASLYHFLGIPVSLYTPVFVCSRVSGWAAHIMEQRAHNRLIRPAADYTGPAERTLTPLAQRR